MTQPSTFGGRPFMPPPGSPAPELLVATFRRHARRLTWSALILVAVAAACGFFYDNLPAPFENWMLLLAGAAIVLVAVFIPFLLWRSRTYTITTRRVIASSGVFAKSRRELPHARGYAIDARRGILQRMWGTGTLTLSSGVEPPMRLVDIPSVGVVQEVLADQVEVSQILAHRDAQAFPGPAGEPQG